MRQGLDTGEPKSDETNKRSKVTWKINENRIKKSDNDDKNYILRLEMKDFVANTIKRYY